MLTLLEGNGTRSYTSLTTVNPTVGKDSIMLCDVVSTEFYEWRCIECTGLVMVLYYRSLFCSCNVLRACTNIPLDKAAKSHAVECERLISFSFVLLSWGTVHLFCCKHSQIATSFGNVLCHNPMFGTRYLLSQFHLCVIWIFLISTSTCSFVGFLCNTWYSSQMSYIQIFIKVRKMYV